LGVRRTLGICFYFEEIAFPVKAVESADERTGGGGKKVVSPESLKLVGGWLASWAATYGCARPATAATPMAMSAWTATWMVLVPSTPPKLFYGIEWDFDAGRFTTLSGLVIVTA
jgi:hypothetical protein